MQYDVVIRCLNEVEWLPDAKAALEQQSEPPENVIFVDSGSIDGSRELAAAYGWNVIDYKAMPFNYSESLNIGCALTTSPAVLILSAHCIICQPDSLAVMIEELSSQNDVGAVYGRQLPTSKSSAHDIRDLLTVFGRERIVYRHYPFFHNAFALIRRSCWQEISFDESVNGIEDRIWAQAIVERGYRIVYQPRAMVFHEHGLNHGTSESRAKRVVKALKVYHSDDSVIDWPAEY